MKKLIWAALTLALTTALAGCQTTTGLSDPTPTHAMKGYELYSWQVQEDWHFALVVGTNRIKTYDEITSPGTRVLGTEALKRELDRLPGGEPVFWITQRVPHMALPPDDVVDEIAAYCRQRDIQLEIERPAARASDLSPSPKAPRPTSTPTPLTTPSPDHSPDKVSANLNTDKVLGVYDDLHVQQDYPYWVTAIATTPEGVWVGVRDASSQVGGRVWRYDGREWHDVTPVEGIPFDERVRVLSAAPDGSLWAGIGCRVLRFAGDAWQELADCPRMKGKVLDITFTPDGAAWVASAMRLSRFDGQTWTSWERLAHFVAAGPDGTLWISGWEGDASSFYVAQLDGVDGTVSDTLYTVDSLGHGVGQIAVTPDGDLWGMAGEDEVARYDGQAWQHYAPGVGLLGDGPAKLVVGPDGVLWLVAPGGLAHFDGQRWVPHEAGLGGNTLALGPDGTLWLGRQGQVVHMRP